MARLISADMFRMSRYWLPWLLLALLVGILTLQVNGKLNELADLRVEIESGVSVHDVTPTESIRLQGQVFQASQLEQELAYPGFIGSAARLSTGFGWFFVILFTAVAGGEDFTRRTLHLELARGIGRGHWLLARCIALWLVTGLGLGIITLLAAATGPYVHSQAFDSASTLEGLGDAPLMVLRAWLTYLPYVAATLFWTVLGQQAGPAMGVGLGCDSSSSLAAFSFRSSSRSLPLRASRSR